MCAYAVMEIRRNFYLSTGQVKKNRIYLSAKTFVQSIRFKPMIKILLVHQFLLAMCLLLVRINNHLSWTNGQVLF